MLGESPQQDYDFKCLVEAKVKYGTITLQHSRVTIECSIHNIEDHGAKSYPKYGNVQPKYWKCDKVHKIEECGIKCTQCGAYGHTKNHSYLKPTIKEINSTSTTNYLKLQWP